MLRRLIAFSIRNALLVLLAAAAVLALAAYQVRRMPVDVFPELNAPTVVILTEAGGLAADEVEQHVTAPIETALNGLSGVRRIRSGSAISLSIVYAEFEWGTDIYRARQQVGERLAAARERLPTDTHTEIAPITGITGEVMLLSLAAADPAVSPTELRAYAEYELATRLSAVGRRGPGGRDRRRAARVPGERPPGPAPAVRADRGRRVSRGRQGPQHRQRRLPAERRGAGGPGPPGRPGAVDRRRAEHGREGQQRPAGHDRAGGRRGAGRRAAARDGVRGRAAGRRARRAEVAGHEHAEAHRRPRPRARRGRQPRCRRA
jgi:hypothetical protein